jgi:L-2-hydroxycarboxylate dehydrogenase (NAD+)
MASEVKTTTIPIKDLERLVETAMRNLGYPADEAATLTEIMMHAEVHNNSQGISKLYDVTSPGGIKFNPDAGPLIVERDSMLGAVVNGNQRSGMSALSKAVQLAVSKAKSGPGMAITGTHNTYTSTGMLAYYASEVGKNDLIGIVMAQSPELVAPHGGKKAVFGTNPICVAIPGPDDGPVILDMATAAVTLFGLITSKANGQQLPPGVAVGPDGQPTRDPDQALKGALLTFGGHKGSGLSLVVELLGGVLPGGATAGGAVSKKEAKNWANTVIAIDPALLMDLGEFKQKVKQVCAHVKSTGERVLLPGEIEKRHYARNMSKGTLDVSTALLGKIQELAAATPQARL